MIKKYKAVPYIARRGAVAETDPCNMEIQYHDRFCIIDTETGEIVDDAQGYGYKTAQNAYKAWGYKNRDKSKDAEKEEKRKLVRNWMKEHKAVIRTLETYEFEIECKGSWGPRDHFNAEFVRKQLEEWGYQDLPFSTKDLIDAMHER